MIPTAKEFFCNHPSHSASEIMIEFTKLHVEAALKAKDDYLNKYGMAEEGYENAYPLENIK